MALDNFGHTFDYRHNAKIEKEKAWYSYFSMILSESFLKYNSLFKIQPLLLNNHNMRF